METVIIPFMSHVGAWEFYFMAVGRNPHITVGLPTVGMDALSPTTVTLKVGERA